MKVRRFKWKFRENHIILVDGRPYEVFWDAPPRTIVLGNPAKMVPIIRQLMRPYVSDQLGSVSIMHQVKRQMMRQP
ncbi:unnamed protein product [Lupinus luteus]|uniref:Uncharacterized protein n=1 Tax=Lupinus luteus TaxID=3873 RepID=A0AAV1XRD8_LUPLU